MSVDTLRTARPDPLALELAIVVRNFEEAVYEGVDGDNFSTAMAPVHRALDHLAGRDLTDLAATVIREFHAAMRHAELALDAVQVSGVRTGDLPTFFRELYTALVRIRSARVRLQLGRPDR